MSGISHSELAPSSAHRWARCPGSVKLRRDNPDLVRIEETEPDEVTLEGITAHWIAKIVLNGEEYPPIDSPCPDGGCPVTEELIDVAAMYVEHVRSVVEQCGPDAMFFNEEPIECLGVHSNCYGVPDYRILDTVNRTLHIFDLKGGFKHVDVIDNQQEMCYSEDVKRTDVDSVIHHIVQPRDYGHGNFIRTFRYTKQEVLDQREELHRAADLAMSENPECVTGFHCTNCTVRQRCTAIRESGWKCVELATSASAVPLKLSELAYELDVLNMAEAVIKALKNAREEEALGIFRVGGTVEGYEAQQGHGCLKWNKPLSEVIQMGEMMGKKLGKEAAITPTQAIAEGISPDLVAMYSERPPGKLKLVKSNTNRARLAFQKEK